MDSWRKVALSRQQMIDHKHMALQNAFEGIFILSDGPKDAAMFTYTAARYPSEYFFSPGAVRISKSLIDQYAGVECAPPRVAELSLLVGTQDSLKSLFEND
jgi:hypothetical protein